MSEKPTVLSGPWSMKGFYFAFFAAVGLFFPFLSLYLQAINLDGTQIGIVFSIGPVINVIFQPLCGMLADRYGWRKPLVAGGLVLSVIMAPLVAFATSFAAFLLPYTLLCIVLSPIVPLSDAATLEWLRKRGGSYGSIRLYGSVGFLITSLAIGPFYAGRGILAIFYFYAAVLFFTFVTSLWAPRQAESMRLAQGENAGSLRHDRILIFFLVLSTFAYSTFAAYNTFFSLYLAQLGAPTSFLGIVTSLSALSELPIMVLAGMIMRRFGVKPLLLAGLGAACLRWFGYGFIHEYHLTLLPGLITGLSFAGFYIGGITFIDHRVPAHLRATGQTLFNIATYGVGTVGGSLLFGLLYDHIGGHALFLVAGVAEVIAVAGLVIQMPNLRPD